MSARGSKAIVTAAGLERREALRRQYRPRHVRMMFVGESPPASGRFFYRGDSGLYRAIRSTFVDELPVLERADFLDVFRDLGCYMVDLCESPVDRLARTRRREICAAGEARLARTISELRPKTLVTLVRSIEANVRRALAQANWEGRLVEVPYPGRWKRHRIEFANTLAPILRQEFRECEAAKVSAGAGAARL